MHHANKFKEENMSDKTLTGAKKDNKGITSSSSICVVSSDSGYMKTFFTTGIGPCTSYKPILWLNVISPKSDPGPRAVVKITILKPNNTIYKNSKNLI